MQIDPELNKILKEMWRIDEKMQGLNELSESEKEFYNQNLAVIKEYYSKNNMYWQEK